MKDNVRDFKVHKGKREDPPVIIPRFVRDVRTPSSERYSIIEGDELELIGSIDLHISDVIQATLVIVPDIDQVALELLVGLIKIELLEPLDLDIKSFNIFKGISECITLEEDFDDDGGCDGDCNNCDEFDCGVDKEVDNDKKDE